MGYDFDMPVESEAMLAAFYVLVLIEREFTFGLIAGGISRERFRAIGRRQENWKHRGDYVPLAVKRSQLSQSYPENFYAPQPFGSGVVIADPVTPLEWTEIQWTFSQW